MLFVLLVALATANIHVSRVVTIDDPNTDFVLNIAPGCSKTDAHGSNDCTMEWGKNYTASGSGAIGTPLAAGSSFNVHLKVDTFIVWDFTCKTCGENCTTTIPVVKKEISFPMPACPIPAASGKFGPISIPLPAKDPVPGGMKVTAKGPITLKNAANQEYAKIEIDISCDKSMFGESMESVLQILLAPFTARQDMIKPQSRLLN